MNPVEITQHLKHSFVSYLTTSFDVNRDNSEALLARELEQAFSAPGALLNGPYLELTPPYRVGCTLEDLMRDGVLSESLRSLASFDQGQPIPLTAKLYSHQQTAIEALCRDERNVVVSAGTGSGKTECFLIPIINDLLVDPSPGVRAVIVYPLNALVNDQLERLRVLLSGTDITFGRYTGELPEKCDEALNAEPPPLPNEVVCREQIWSEGKLPQILITNYAMLEYLLLRPEDSQLFESGKWKYLVLDEAHTYSGAQGTEVSYLIRRLKHRLGKQPGEIRCIATSATLTADDAEQAAMFAATLFGEEFETDDVVFGKTDPTFAEAADSLYTIDPHTYLQPEVATLVGELRAEQRSGPELAAILASLGMHADVEPRDWSGLDTEAVLWHFLRRNSDVAKLRAWFLESEQPRGVGDTAAFLFNDLDPEDRLSALFNLIELGAKARPGLGKPSLLPARYHLFMRPPAGMWVCVNPACPDRPPAGQVGWSKVFAKPTETCDSCRSHVYPLTACRSCGQTYVRVVKEGDRYLAQATTREKAEVNYLVWQPIEKKRELSEDIVGDEAEELVDDSGDDEYSSNMISLCLACQHTSDKCTCGSERKLVDLYRVEQEKKKKRGRQNYRDTIAATELNSCPRCRDKARDKQEIVTTFQVGTIGPLSLIARELYRSLPASTRPEQASLPGEGRKLLSFYDSRQGAARFAAFLQDTEAADTFRHLIPVAVNACVKRNGEPPDFKELAEEVLDRAWVSGVLHNNPVEELGKIKRSRQAATSAQERHALSYVMLHLMVEFTSRRRARNSLESLGIVAVDYVPMGKADTTEIADALGVDPQSALAFIGFLLNDLRKDKVIKFPDKVDFKSELFGQNKSNPVVIRTASKTSSVGWIGKTDRQVRRRMVQRLLKEHGKPHQDDDVKHVLNLMFTWLIGDAGLLTGNAGYGYQIDLDRLTFSTQGSWQRCDRCFRFSLGTEGLICPNRFCEGHLRPADELVDFHQSNYYASSFKRELVPMRVEEHTAQLTSKHGQEYQQQFKQGKINVLSCSTTFEMGIDLGDLQAVVLSNVPPTVANYRQRSGRAGRRAGGTAFILTWCSERPHDQTFFAQPPEIIAGHVRVPHLATYNPLIFARHRNAVLLSEFMRFRKDSGGFRRTGEFFGTQQVDNAHIDHVEEWLNEYADEIAGVCSSFARYLPEEAATDVELWPKAFSTKLEKDGTEYFRQIANLYETQRQKLLARQMSGDLSGETAERTRRYASLLDRLEKEPLINWLSDRGILPSYSFPLHTVDLHVPRNVSQDIRLQRNLRQAIREYAPGQEIVADKRIWRSEGLFLFRGEPQLLEYFLCEHCNNLEIAQAASIPVDATTCKVCGRPPSKKNRAVRKYIRPDGFKASSDSGKPAGRHVGREPTQMRSAIIPSTAVDLRRESDLLTIGREKKGQILYVNEGPSGSGYRMCMKCGAVLKRGDKVCKAKIDGQTCGGRSFENNLALGFKEETQTLHLRFDSHPNVPLPEEGNISFWLSFASALVHAISRHLQIERREIGAVLQPLSDADGTWKQTIVLYDDVPGGAGHVQQAEKEIQLVLEEALRIANCVDCAPDSSCYTCLRDYSNQFDHHLLKRGPVASYLEALLASRSTEVVHPVLAINHTRWLMQRLDRVEYDVLIVAESITDEAPLGERFTWVEVIQKLLQRGVSVRLALASLPETKSRKPEALSLARWLQVLIENGLELYESDAVGEWNVLIDVQHGVNPEALRARPGDAFILNANAGSSGLLRTVDSKAVAQARQSVERLRLRAVAVEELNPPPGVSVKNISEGAKHTERELFGHLFTEQPVVGLLVSDRYINGTRKIHDRLGAYIKLAADTGALRKVTVFTTIEEDKEENKARQFDALRKQFPSVEIQHTASRETEHDRYVILTRADGTKAKILLAAGLDFIGRNGLAKRTHIVVEDPWREPA